MAITKEHRLLRIGVLGCGPISQSAHFDACHKARNAELYAICDRSEELLTRMTAIHQPKVSYGEFDEMLADAQVEAVIVATADQFHVPLCQKAIAAGKHVLVEKPLGVTVEECEELRRQLRQTGLVLQVGNNKRFDPGVSFAQRFIRDEIGELMAIKAWYNDSFYRYAMTDNLQPLPITSATAMRPQGSPKEDKQRYFLLAHGSHLVDMMRFLAGELASVQARLVEKFGAYCWFAGVDLENGSTGHLDLTITVRGDFEEGFRVYGEYGSVNGRLYLPWYHKSSEVECFSIKDNVYRRPLGQDAYTYKLQIEGFADTILHGKPMLGAGIEDGVAAVRALVALSHSAATGERVFLEDMTGGV
jgi:predicted dehydrogenase